MIRLNQVIKLEEKIRNLLELAPSNYTPPICQFNCSPNKQTKQKKTPAAQPKTLKKSHAAPDAIVESQNITLFDMLHTQNAANRCSTKVKTNFSSLSYGPKEIYR